MAEQPDHGSVFDYPHVRDRLDRVIRERDEAREGMRYAYDRFKQMLPTYDAALQEVFDSGNQSALSATLIAIEMLVAERDEARAQVTKLDAQLQDWETRDWLTENQAWQDRCLQMQVERDEARAEVKHFRDAWAAAQVTLDTRPDVEAERDRLRDEILRRSWWREAGAPCAICGYDGPGYYQPDMHVCAKLAEELEGSHGDR